VSDLDDLIIKKTLPSGSSRQVVKKELLSRVFHNISEKFSNNRRDRRELARRLTKDLYKQGERLSE